jgi:hypothetical protein
VLALEVQSVVTFDRKVLIEYVPTGNATVVPLLVKGGLGFLEFSLVLEIGNGVGVIYDL